MSPQTDWQLEDFVIEAFLRLRDDNAVAEEIGVPLDDVARIVDRRVPDAAVLRGRPVEGEYERFSDREIIASLRDASASLPSPLTRDNYAEWCRAHPRARSGASRPGWQTAIRRFGTWRAALLQAGLPANTSRGPGKAYDYDDCLGAVAAAWVALGHPPTVAEYDVWSPARDGVPSSPTLRKWNAWPELLAGAWFVVHAATAADFRL